MIPTVTLQQGELSLFKPLRLRKRGGRKMILVPEGTPTTELQGTIDQPLLKALVRAYLWQRQLKKGKYPTIQDLCEAHKVTHKYVSLILRLNYLAPKLKQAILQGHQPRSLKLADLIQGFPLLWDEQADVFGMPITS
jgi:hypothetical protein